LPLLDKATNRTNKNLQFGGANVDPLNAITFTKFTQDDLTSLWRARKPLKSDDYSSFLFTPFKLINLSDVLNFSESFVYGALKNVKARRKKVYFTKCSDRTLTTAG